MPTKPDPTPNPAAAKLKKWRKSRKMSQGDLARLLEVKQSTVSLWESERTRPVEQLRTWLEQMTNRAVKTTDWQTSTERKRRARTLKRLGAQQWVSQ